MEDAWYTPAMVQAGVEELREKYFGQSLDDIVTSIYIAMEAERRANSPDRNPTGGDAKLGSVEDESRISSK